MVKPFNILVLIGIFLNQIIDCQGNWPSQYDTRNKEDF
jgi:hypothetical protein